MTRRLRLIAPLIGATTTFAFAGTAWSAQGAGSENPAEAKAPSSARDFDAEAPIVTSQAGHRVAGTQVEGEASISTGGASSSTSGSSGGELQGRFGLGAIRTISGLTGVNARYFVLDQLSIGLNMGIGTWTYKENDPASTDVCPGPDCRLEETRTVATLGMGLEALYFVKLGNPAGQLPFYADFGLGGRFTYFQGINNADVNNNHDDPTEVDIEIPLVLQLRFGDHFVLSPEFGAIFIIVPGSREDGDVNPGTFKPDTSLGPNDGIGGPYSGPGFGFRLGNGVGLFGGASMHYYF
jgi:hypothetical protein